jgi:zinc/manganese transport system ATP-binding protein
MERCRHEKLFGFCAAWIAGTPRNRGSPGEHHVDHRRLGCRLTAMTAFKLHNVTLGYEGHPAVHHLDGEVAQGSLTAVVGPNGSGKSTLLKGLCGAISPLSGRIDRNGFGIRDMAYLPQVNEIDRSFPATVEDLVTLGLWRRRGLFAAIRQEDRSDIRQALSGVGLDGFQSRPIDTLSGGQLQRALFARVLLQDAKVILLDEPFTAIDSKTAADLIDLVCRWQRERRTIVAVLHDIDLVREHFPETVLLAREPVAWGRTGDALKPENLLKARRMNEAWDADAPWCEVVTA